MMTEIPFLAELCFLLVRAFIKIFWPVAVTLCKLSFSSCFRGAFSK